MKDKKVKTVPMIYTGQMRTKVPGVGWVYPSKNGTKKDIPSNIASSLARDPFWSILENPVTPVKQVPRETQDEERKITSPEKKKAKKEEVKKDG